MNVARHQSPSSLVVRASDRCTEDNTPVIRSIPVKDSYIFCLPLAYEILTIASFLYIFSVHL